ncbi:MAG: hypothetical protein JO069_03370 [Verrucomicrobia bacterium]|nr:hypothetical protein [Verrucomicrobiota bacterium]
MLTYETGNPHFGGRTFVRLDGNGDVLVEQTHGQQVRTFVGQVDPAACAEILAHFTTARERRQGAICPAEDPPVPGETVVTVRAVIGPERSELSFWSNRRWADPALARLVSGFERLASAASGGVVRF